MNDTDWAFEILENSHSAVAELGAFLETIDGDFPIPLSRKVDLREYSEKLLGRGLVAVARADGEVVGVAGGYANDEGGLRGFLSVMGASRAARGTGMAGALLGEFERLVRGRGMALLDVPTHSSNARAIAFYRKHGYAVGERLDGIGNVTCTKLLCGLSPERPNILLTSVGRRAYLVEWFKEALAGTGEVHVVNSDPSTPAFAAANASAACPLIYSDGYIPFLLDYVEGNRIGAVLSLFDIDVPVLAEHRGNFARLGCFPVVAPPRTARVCNDKLLAARVLGEAGIPTVATYAGVDAFLGAVAAGVESFPAFVKPRWGMGSIGVLEVADEWELRAACAMVGRKAMDSYLRYESVVDPDGCVIVQGVVNAQECGMDVMNGLDCRFRACSARRKVAMRAGETDVAETIVGDVRFESLAKAIAGTLPCPGNMDVDVFDDGGVLRVLEMNARFGGGYPFSHMAGVNLPRAIVAWLRGELESEGSLEVDHPGRFMKEIELVRLEAVE